MLLTSIALISGFLLLIAVAARVWAAWPFARVTSGAWPGAKCWFTPRSACPAGGSTRRGRRMGWLVGFYSRRRRAGAAPPAVAEAVPAVRSPCGCSSGSWRAYRPRTSDELRVTFLAVGHGGCVVIETPDGRVLLYDAGTTTGPDAVRRAIAPYLWCRGISRIDEVFLSHADLDHFNGMPELLKRFPVGRVTVTPSFAEKPTPGRGGGARGARAAAGSRRGSRWPASGSRPGAVSFDVLHPPMEGPAGARRERAEHGAARPRHGGHTILLTGDLEGEGQALVRERPVPPVDVMLAPHHGGKTANAALPGAGRDAGAGTDGGVGAAEAGRVEPAAGADGSPRGRLRRRRRDGVGHADGGGGDGPLSRDRRGRGGVPQRRGAGGGAREVIV